MIRVSCPRADAHQTMSVAELLRTGFQKGADNKYHVNPNLPKTVRKIAYKPTNLFGLAVLFTVVAVAPLLWQRLDPGLWAKMPLSMISEYLGTPGHWVVIGSGAALAVLLWKFWRPGHLQKLRMRKEGIYCYVDDEIFFAE